MKKILSTALTILISAVMFTGCGERADKNNNSIPDTTSKDSYSSTVKGFSGNIYRRWEDAEDDFKSEENAAQAEVGAITTISRGDIENTLKEMQDDLKELEDGVTKNNEAKAREVYKDAHKLELMAKKGDVEASKEFEHLAESTKKLIKQYYGEADEDYNTVRDSVNEGFNKIKNFTEDVWNSFLDLFR